MGKFDLMPGLVIGDLNTECPHMLRQRGRTTSPEKDPQPSLRYENPIPRKARPLIRRMEQE